MTIKAILFDLDGTLIDTNQLILHTFHYTLNKVLKRTLTDQQLIETFGRPLLEIMAEIDAPHAQELLDTYRKYNAQVHDDWVTIFPTVEDTLATLKRHQIKLAVVTSKQNKIALRGLQLFDIEPYFDVFIGSDDTQIHKPNPEPLLKALSLLQVAPEDAIMVGDSPFDILAGQHAGTKTIGVRYTAHGPDALLPYDPDFMIDEFADILSLLNI